MAHRRSPNLVVDYLLSCAAHNAGGEVLVQGARRVTWGELCRRVLQLANALLRAGVRPGDKVALVLHNCPEFVEANYAVQAAGAVPVPANYRFTGGELSQQIAHSDARAVIYAAPWRAATEAATAGLTALAARLCVDGDDGPGAPPPGDGPDVLRYEAFLATGAARDPAVPTTWDDLAVITYTGGTTGYPKGVMLTYGAFREMFASLFASVIGRAAEVELSPAQRQGLGEFLPLPAVHGLASLLQLGVTRRVLGHPLTFRAARAALREALSRPAIMRFGYGLTTGYMTPSMPFFHSASYQILMLGLLGGKLCHVLTPGTSFDPRLVLETIARERPAFLANVPTAWRKLVSFPDFARYDVSAVRVAATGTGLCPLALKEQIFARFPGVIIVDMFGQTEMTPITAFRVDAGPATLKERSVGRSTVEVRVVDEAGAALPPGAIGEICYRSGTVMKGYYKDEARTRAVLQGGWLRSGDLGYLDADGELCVVDRKQACINTGGEKVFPLEVEEVLLRHPAVEDASVFGVADEEWGQAVHAVVQLRDGGAASVADLLAHCRATLAGYKVPKHLALVDEVPRSEVGKVQRRTSPGAAADDE